MFVATSDEDVNRAVARSAARRHLFVNAAGDPEAGSIQMPALLRRGALLVAISTSGRSPGAARALRDDLARRFGREYSDYVAIIGAVRGRVLRCVGEGRDRRRRLRALLRAPILPLLRRGSAGAARAAARRAAGLTSRRAR